MKYVFLFFLFIGLFQSCEKPELGGAKNNNEIDLYNLKVGQISKFEFFVHTATLQDTIYPRDTLILEVESEEDGKYLISERLSLGSNVLETNGNYMNFSSEATYSNYWSINEDINGRFVNYEPVSNGDYSILFLEQRSLRLDEYDDEELQITEKDFDFVKGICGEKYTSNFSLKGERYDHLNVSILSDKVGDPAYYTVFFNEEHGVLRTFLFADWNIMFYGWDRIN